MSNNTALDISPFMHKCIHDSQWSTKSTMKYSIQHIRGAVVNVAEAAELLHLTRSAINLRIQKGTMKAVKIGKSYVIPREELELAIKERKAELRRRNLFFKAK